jgi:UPF0755 protein
MGRLMLRLASLLLLLLLAGAAAGVWAYAQFTRPGPLTTDRTTVIPPGSGLQDIAETLASAGIIEIPEIFILGARITRSARDLKAGEFAFPARVSPREAMQVLRAGKTVVRRLTIAEGQTVTQVLERLSAAEGLVGAVDGPIPEGSLLPETYHFSFGDTRADLVKRMRRDMHETVNQLWKSRAAGLPLASPEEAVILASIVEKETGVAAERARVAGVFINRLKRRMRLQSDPTVAYGVAPQGLDRPLSRSDLKRNTPYNTYVHKGLPPGPITNPGRAALAATLNPAQTDFLYFVADGSGGHAFAKTLKAHNRNVARRRRHQRQTKQ